jgi:hypothetical protein
MGVLMAMLFRAGQTDPLQADLVARVGQQGNDCAVEITPGPSNQERQHATQA